MTARKGTPSKKKAMIEGLRAEKSIAAACRLTQIGRRTYYNWREEDPAFAADADEAMDDFVDGLEDEAIRRAQEGILEPVFYQGQQVGEIRKFSDTLLIFMLKAKRPDIYRDQPATNVDAAQEAAKQIAAQAAGYLMAMQDSSAKKK